MVRDRETWCAAVHGVTKSWIWLGDWTTTIPRSPGPELSFGSIFLPSSLPQASYSQIMPVFPKSLDFPMWCVTFLFYKKLVLKLLTLKTTLGVYFMRPTRSYFPCLLIHPLQLPSQWVLFKVLTISIKLPSWHPFPPPPRNAWKGIQLWADVRSFSKAFCVK